jgi:hypothetical protein
MIFQIYRSLMKGKIPFQSPIFQIKSPGNTIQINYSDAPGGLGDASAPAAVVTPHSDSSAYRFHTIKRYLLQNHRTFFHFNVRNEKFLENSVDTIKNFGDSINTLP